MRIHTNTSAHSCVLNRLFFCALRFGRGTWLARQVAAAYRAPESSTSYDQFDDHDPTIHGPEFLDKGLSGEILERTRPDHASADGHRSRTEGAASSSGAGWCRCGMCVVLMAPLLAVLPAVALSMCHTEFGRDVLAHSGGVCAVVLPGTDPAANISAEIEDIDTYTSFTTMVGRGLEIVKALLIWAVETTTKAVADMELMSTTVNSRHIISSASESTVGVQSVPFGGRSTVSFKDPRDQMVQNPEIQNGQLSYSTEKLADFGVWATRRWAEIAFGGAPTKAAEAAAHR
eukprot:SAG31_NODE_5834_length_2303_cov_2.077586_2_plen_288_part_00